MSYAQFETDLAVAGLFPEGYVGTYLDIGAHHPVSGSNTYLFYRRGWRGVTVEPTKKNYEFHRALRPDDFCLNLAVSNVCGEATFFEMDESSVSTLCPDQVSLLMGRGQGSTLRRVETTTVARIIDRINGLALNNYHDDITSPRWWKDFTKCPDVLSIDVEGHERQVLEGCPWDKAWRPKVIVLEACYPCTSAPCDHLWLDLLDEHGYRKVASCGVNNIYYAGK